MIRTVLVILALSLTGSCLAGAAIGAVGTVAGATINAAGTVAGATIDAVTPGDRDERRERAERQETSED